MADADSRSPAGLSAAASQGSGAAASQGSGAAASQGSGAAASQGSGPAAPAQPSAPVGAEGADYFDREYFQLHPGKQKYLEYLIRLLRSHGVGGGRVLDIGSGYGFFLEALDKAGYEAHGIEQSAHAVAAARERSGAVIVNASAEAPFPFPDGSFAAITLLDVIEHLDDYPATLASCRRALAPGGKLFVITLNAGSLARPILGRRWAFHLDPTHVHMFSAARLRQAFRDAGLTEVSLTTMSNFYNVGEGNPLLKPLRRIGRVVTTPWLGDSLLGVARRD